MKLTQIIHCEENITYGVTENSQYDSLRALCNAIMYIKCSESRKTWWCAQHYFMDGSNDSNSVHRDVNGQVSTTVLQAYKWIWYS